MPVWQIAAIGIKLREDGEEKEMQLDGDLMWESAIGDATRTLSICLQSLTSKGTELHIVPHNYNVTHVREFTCNTI